MTMPHNVNRGLKTDTVNWWITRFLDFLNVERGYSEFTVSSYRRDLMQFSVFLETVEEKTSPASIDRKIIRRFVEHIHSGGAGNTTLRRKNFMPEKFFSDIL